jgi:hypothetical protein
LLTVAAGNFTRLRTGERPLAPKDARSRDRGRCPKQENLLHQENPFPAMHPIERRLTHCDRARLVEHQGIDLAQVLDRLRIPEQHAELRTATAREP